MNQFKKNQKENQCYFDDLENKKCFPTGCNDYQPRSTGWTIYTYDWCPFCHRTKDLFTEKKIKYYNFNIEKEPFNGKENYLKMMKSYLDGHKTLPAVFKNGKLIGGYTDLVKVL